MKRLLTCFVFLFLTVSMWADLNEGFNDVTTLPGAGWVQTNNSSPIGSTGWYQGESFAFAAHSGAANSYIAANFDNAGFGGDISNWLLTPVLTIQNGDTISFWTRTDDSSFLDSLEVRFSTNGSSSNVGSTSTSVGDFVSLLLTINPGSYPNDWTQFTATVSGLGGVETGRYGFHYVVNNTALNGDYIGIDDVNVSQVPEPATMTLLISGLAGAMLRRRRNL